MPLVGIRDTGATRPVSAGGTVVAKADGGFGKAMTTDYPATNAINTLLYASAANVMSVIAAANSAIMVSSAGGVPSMATDIPTAVTIGGNYVYRAGGTDVPVTDGGTGASDAANAATNLGLGTAATVQHAKLGVGQANSVGIAQILAADNGTCLALNINATQANVTAADFYAQFYSTSGMEGFISGTAGAGVLVYQTFTGGHMGQSVDPLLASREDTTRIDERAAALSTREAEFRTAQDAFLLVRDQYLRLPESERAALLPEFNTKLAAATDAMDAVKVAADLLKDTNRHFVSDTIEFGTVLVSTDEMCAWPNEGVSTTLPKVAVSTKPKDKAVYGVYGGHDLDADIIVLALGTGLVLVCDEGGAIEIGDLLCTSSVAGHAMKQDDDIRHGFTLGKARQAFTGSRGKIAFSNDGG